VECTCGRVHHLRARRLTGAAVGGLTSGTASWLNHRSEVRLQWILHEKTRRQTLYRDFIEEAAKCYIDALQHDEANIPGLVSLYAKLSSMRVPSLTGLPFSSKSLSAWPSYFWARCPPAVPASESLIRSSVYPQRILSRSQALWVELH
jgi:hypothetical protein